MSTDDFNEKATALQDDVDAVVAAGLTAASQRVFADSSLFDWQQSLADIRLLNEGQDGFYDRPAVGVPYGFRYHLRRVNPLVSYFANRSGGEHHIIDIGSGTGAVAWAIGLGTVIRAEMGLPATSFVIHEFDSSTGMLAVADDLWDSLTSRWPEIGDAVERRSSVANWVDASIQAHSPELVASYLFDHSDLNRAEEVGRALSSLMERSQVERALFVSNTSKLELVKAALEELQNDGWLVDASRPTNTVWSGKACQTSTAQFEARSRCGDQGDLIDVQFLSEQPRLIQVRSGKAQKSLPVGLPQKFNNEQMEVIESNAASRRVVGVAGSGKSLVLAEVIARHLEREVSSPEHLLVTTFNRAVINLLHDVLAERFESSIGQWTMERRSDGHYRYREVGRSRDTLTMATWDGLVKHHLGRGHEGGIDESVHRRAISDVLEKLRRSNNRWRRLEDGHRLLDPSFYQDELRFVMYGLSARDEAAYLHIRRHGRGIPLREHQRKMVLEVLEKAGRQGIFLERRWALAELTSAQHCAGEYDALFIDEGQDFLPADFATAYALATEQPKVVLVFDDGQAVHTGASTGSAYTMEGRAFEKFRLTGSYRIPASIAQALVPVAETIRERRVAAGVSTDGVAIPESRKASVVGVRPILIVGDREQLAQQIIDIQADYDSILQASSAAEWTCTVLQSDRELATAIQARNGRAMPNSVMKIKGRERPMVVWSTRTAPRGDRALEVAYTAMTRATTVLVLAVDLEHSEAEALEAVRLLDPEYVMAWNQRAAEWLEADATCARSSG